MSAAPNSATNGAAAPPHNLEAEQSVLGAILLTDRPMYALVIEEGLRPDDFYRDRHRLIYEAMLALYSESAPVDVLTVSDRLRQTGRLEEAGGPRRWTSSRDSFPPPRTPAATRRSCARTRCCAACSPRPTRSRPACWATRAAPRELVEQAEKAMLEVARDDRQQDFRSIEDILGHELDKLHRLSKEGTSLTGTPSGFKDLDELTGGFQRGNLVIIAARPAMGKSSLVANIAENAAVEHGKSVALFSLEMSEAELAQRFVASQARIKGEELRKGRVAETRWPKIVAASQRLAAAPLWVDDSSDIGMLEIRAKARRLHNQAPGGLGLIIVDYLQLLRTDSRHESRVTAVGELSRGLKILARELDVPVIALSQLSRAVESRSPKIPQLSDLRESGNVEQDADLVVFIYREEYYEQDSERIGEADLIIAKHRNGAVGTVTLTFQKEYPKFMNYAGDRYAA